MREIIFRGKRIDNGEWVSCGTLIHFNPENGEDPVFMPGLNEECTCTHDEFDNIIAFDKVDFYKVDPETVGQYTGLEDKNGKKIFEGDIVRCGTGRICKVTFFISPGVSGFDLVAIGGFDAPPPHNWVLFIDTEVIGNIHDNPELLRGNRQCLKY